MVGGDEKFFNLSDMRLFLIYLLQLYWNMMRKEKNILEYSLVISHFAGLLNLHFPL